MNWRSRSSTALLAAMLVSSCAKQHESVRVVNSDAYGASACWYDRDGYFVAFLVLAEDSRVVVPYAVSTKCLVNGDYSSYGEAVLHHLNTILLVDSFQTLQSRLPGVIVSDNVRSDQPMPSSESPLFYFKAKLARVHNPYKMVYAPQRIEAMKKTDVTFDKFLSMSLEQRKSFLKANATELR